MTSILNAQEKHTEEILNHVIEKSDDWMKTTSDIQSNLKTGQERLQKVFDDARKKNDEVFAKFSGETERCISDVTTVQERIMNEIAIMTSKTIVMHEKLIKADTLPINVERELNQFRNTVLPQISEFRLMIKNGG